MLIPFRSDTRQKASGARLSVRYPTYLFYYLLPVLAHLRTGRRLSFPPIIRQRSLFWRFFFFHSFVTPFKDHFDADQFGRDGDFTPRQHVSRLREVFYMYTIPPRLELQRTLLGKRLS